MTYREHSTTKEGKLSIQEPVLPSEKKEGAKPLKPWEGGEIQRMAFLRFEDLDYILQRAQKHEVYIEKKPYDQGEYEDSIYKRRKYLDPRILEFEKLQPFNFRELEMYEGTKEELLTLAERSQMVQFIIEDI